MPRLPLLAVETHDRQAGRAILSVGHLLIKLAANPVLGAEKLDQFYIWCMKENVDGRLAVSCYAGVIGDEPDLEPAQRAKPLGDQNVDPALHAFRGLGVGFLTAADPARASQAKESYS